MPLVVRRRVNSSSGIAENRPELERGVHDVAGEDASSYWGAIVLAVLLVPAGLALLLVVLAKIEPALLRPVPAPPEPAGVVGAQPAGAGLNVLVNTEK